MLVETRRDGDVVWGVRNVLLAVKVVVVDWRGVVVIIILDDLVEEFGAARFLGLLLRGVSDDDDIIRLLLDGLC